MSTQPTTCGQCSLCEVGRGFALPSGNPATAKLAFVLEVPTGEDVGWFLSDPTPAITDPRSEVLRRQHLYPDLQKEWLVKGVLGAGRAGSILNNWLLPKVSIDRRDIYVTSVLRCVPPRSKQGREYPTGTVKNVAESVCRQYDRLLEFKPDAFVITFAPLDLVKEITPLPLVIRDLEKAVAFVRSGLRTVVLMGGHAAETYLGWGSNVVRFRGDYALIQRWGGVEAWWARVLERTSARAAKKARTRKKVVKGWGGQTPSADLGFGPTTPDISNDINSVRDIEKGMRDIGRKKRIVRCKALVSLIADEPLRECGEVREQHPTTWCGKFVGRRKKVAA